MREQGGDVRCIDNTDLLPRAAHREEIFASATGFVTAIECERIGVAGLILGGGRFTKEEAIDPAVEIVLHKKVGDVVTAGEPLCTVHYNSFERFADARPIITAAYSIGATKPQARSLIHGSDSWQVRWIYYCLTVRPRWDDSRE